LQAHQYFDAIGVESIVVDYKRGALTPGHIALIRAHNEAERQQRYGSAV